MTQNNVPPQYGYGNPNTNTGETFGMQSTDWSYFSNQAAIATVTGTLVPAFAIGGTAATATAASGQLWEVGWGVQANNAATSTLTATFVIGWTSQTHANTATISATVASQATTYLTLAPDNNTAVTYTWTATVQNGTGAAAIFAVASRVL